MKISLVLPRDEEKRRGPETTLEERHQIRAYGTLCWLLGQKKYLTLGWSLRCAAKFLSTTEADRKKDRAT